MARKTSTPITGPISTVYTRYLAFCRARNFSESTITGYEITFRRFAEFLDDKEFRTITVDDVVDFMGHIAGKVVTPDGVAPRKPRKLAPKTVRNYHGALGSLYSWATERDPSLEHLVQFVPAPVAPHQPIAPTPPEDLLKLMKACVESRPYHNNVWASNFRPTAERDKLIIAILLDTCMRASELCNMRIQDVSLRRGGGTCKIIEGKGKKSRYVSFGKRTRHLLDDWLATREYEPEDYLICNWQRHEGSRMSRDGLGRLLKRISERAGVRPEVTPHQLRRTGAVILVRHGVNAFQLQRIMGHSDIQTTMRYVQAGNLDEQEAQRRFSPMDQLRL